MRRFMTHAARINAGAEHRFQANPALLNRIIPFEYP